MTMTTATTDTYALGSTERELDRLISQASYYGDLTEHVFGLAGIEPGMRVLDIGCGAGDVSFLAARLVGPDGSVTGVDASADAIDLARKRAREAGLANVRFLVDDITSVSLDVPVDALVGRLILMYLADPAAALRKLRPLLAPGGLMVFHEMDIYGAVSQPPCPLLEATAERIRETLRRVGADARVGLRLRQIFQDAGLPEPHMILGARVEGGPDAGAYRQITEITRTLLAPMVQTGVASAAEVDIDTLERRLRAEVLATNATIVLPHFVGAWAVAS
jgi:SAM-dependent methyltransferase